MPRTYSFKEQLIAGEKAEEVVKDYLSQWYTVLDTNIDDQRKGIDFFLKHPDGIFSVELKTDFLTKRTGNIFVETDSVLETGKLGWAWTSQADLLFYYALPNELFIANLEDVRDRLIDWIKVYKYRQVRNATYRTRGVPVPKVEFSKACKAVIELELDI